MTGFVEALVVWVFLFVPTAAVLGTGAVIASDLLSDYPSSVRWVGSIPSWAAADGPATALRRAGRTVLSGALDRWYWFRTPIARADLPSDGGPVVVHGTAEAGDGTLRAPATGQECLAYGCTVYDVTSPRALLSPESKSTRLVREVGEAIPFSIADGDGSIVVDPNPVELHAPVTPGDASGEDDGRDGPDWSLPEDVSTHDTVLLPVGMDPREAARDRLTELFDGTDLRVGRDRVRIHEWRLEPGQDVAVLGQWVDEVTAPDRDVLHLPEARHPFAVAPEEAATDRPVLPLLVVVGVVVPALLATCVATVVFWVF